MLAALNPSSDENENNLGNNPTSILPKKGESKSKKKLFGQSEDSKS